jgi:predicted GIY-YIG superfamily endonuclease
MKQPAVYMMASQRNGTLYAGVTSHLVRRAWQHREGELDGFTKHYGCKLLVWFEMADTMDSAIMREKQLKGGSRRKKLALIEAANPHWNDLYPTIVGGWIASSPLAPRNDGISA